MTYEAIIIGAGPAGATAARRLAEAGKKVLVLDRREGVGGNCYDEKDEYGITVHKYGPHIFHTNIKRVYDFLSRFTEWYDYSHEVVANVYGEEIPVPFNLNTLEMVFPDEAVGLEKLLTDRFGEGARVPILKLREADDEGLKKIADYVYENIFLKYTMKQWGKSPEEIDPAVSGRVPVVISRDNRYFQDTYQGMPKNGYTPLFEKMLAHENITFIANTDSSNVLRIDPDADVKVSIRNDLDSFVETMTASDSTDNAVSDINASTGTAEASEFIPFDGRIIFTGAIDELFDYRFGHLPYRSLEFRFEHLDKDRFQSHAVVNYTVSEDFTRITEFKAMTGEDDRSGTTIIREYPFAYTGAKGEIPYYAINTPENDALYEKYKALADEIPALTLLGRLAEYKYYNIDAIVDRALEI